MEVLRVDHRQIVRFDLLTVFLHTVREDLEQSAGPARWVVDRLRVVVDVTEKLTRQRVWRVEDALFLEFLALSLE